MFSTPVVHRYMQENSSIYILYYLSSFSPFSLYSCFFSVSTDGKSGCISERLLHTLHLNVKSYYAVDAFKCIYCNSCNISIRLIASLQCFLLLRVRLSQFCRSLCVNLTRFQPYLTSIQDDMMFSVTLLHNGNMWRLSAWVDFIEPNHHCSQKLLWNDWRYFYCDWTVST